MTQRFSTEPKTSAILSRELLEVPGPGEYDVKESYKIVVSKGGASSIGTSKRSSFLNGEEGGPGPGNYRIPSIFDKYKRKGRTSKKLIYNGIYVT